MRQKNQCLKKVKYMFSRTGNGYDQSVSMFSPDGRLFQVEYAREAVKRGTTAVGVKAKDGVVLLVDKRITSRLIEAESILIGGVKINLSKIEN